MLKRALGTMALHAKWNDAPQGRLPPKEQAKLWALREVLRKQGEDCQQYLWMAGQVQVKGGGPPSREAPRLRPAGADLLSLAAEALVSDVRLTPFAMCA